MIANLLEKIRAVGSGRTVNARRKFRSFVVASATGRPVSPDDIAVLLAELNCSAEEFVSCVDVHIPRVELQATIDRTAGAFERSRQAAAEIERTRADHAEAIAELDRKFKARLDPLHARRSAADAEMSDHQSAEAELRRGCCLPWVVRGIAQLEGEIRLAQRECEIAENRTEHAERGSPAATTRLHTARATLKQLHDERAALIAEARDV